jgi:hypothetical protein
VFIQIMPLPFLRSQWSAEVAMRDFKRSHTESTLGKEIRFAGKEVRVFAHWKNQSAIETI